MKFFRVIIKFISFLFFFIRLRDYRLAYLFAHYHIPLKSAALVKREGSQIVFTQTGNRIPVHSAYPYKEELRSVITVLNDPRIKVVTEDPTKGLLIKAGNISMNVRSVSNMFTCYEIFLERLYDLSTPGADNVIVDIGMNVGFASLFFANSSQTAHVYSFEPFPETFREAVDNIGLNPELHAKITPYNYGISSDAKVVDVPRLESGSAVASTSELFVEHNRVMSDQNIRVEVKGILEVLEDITSAHPHSPLFLKVDCEGEEYGIMDKLNGTELMKKVSGFFIEWHIQGPDRILNVLKSNGFTSLHLPRVGVDSGMIYAFPSA